MRTIMRLLAVLLIAAAAGGCGSDAGSSPSAVAAIPAPVPAVKLPETLPQLDLAGFHKLIAEADAADQVLVIDFWATWCVPCVEKFPEIHEKMTALGPKVRLISVTLDAPGTFERRAIEFLDQHDSLHDGYMLLADAQARPEITAALATRWNDLAVPAILIFGPDGKLAEEYLDNEPVDTMVEKVQSLLSEPNP